MPVKAHLLYAIYHLSTSLPLCQNTFLDVLATPKHYTWSHLATSGNTWSHLVKIWQHMVTPSKIILPFSLHQNTIPGHTWSHLATPGHLLATPGHILATPGNTWSPLTANMRTETATSIVAPPSKFEFPALFLTEP